MEKRRTKGRDVDLENQGRSVEQSFLGSGVPAHRHWVVEDNEGRVR